MPMVLGMQYFALFFVGALYWPLIFIRIRGAYKNFEMTRRKIAVSILFSAVSAFIVFSYVVMEDYLETYFPLALAASIVPVVLLLAVPSSANRRTTAKLLVLAVYFHIVWQMVPQINVIILVSELLVTLGILFVSSYNRKKKPLLYKTSETSIGDIWK